MKKIYFDLEIQGQRITNIEELKENFHLQQVTDYFDNKVLDIWLENKDNDILTEIKKLRSQDENDIKLKSIDLSKKEKYTGLIKAFNMEESDYKIIIDGLVDSDNIPIEAKNHNEKNKDLAKIVFNDNLVEYEKSLKGIPTEEDNSSWMAYLENKALGLFNGRGKITFLDTNNFEKIEENIKYLDNAYSFLKELDKDKIFEKEILSFYKKVQPIILIKMLSKHSLRETIMIEKDETKRRISDFLMLSGNTKEGRNEQSRNYYTDHFNHKDKGNKYLILRDKNQVVTLEIVNKEYIEKCEKEQDISKIRDVFTYIPIETN